MKFCDLLCMNIYVHKTCYHIPFSKTYENFQFDAWFMESTLLWMWRDDCVIIVSAFDFVCNNTLYFSIKTGDFVSYVDVHYIY